MIAQKVHCSYALLDNGIHQFVFHQSTRQAVDEHIEQLESLYQTTAPDTLLRILIDLRPGGFPPMTYTFQTLRRSHGRYPNRPKTRYAFVYKGGFMLLTATSFFDLLNPSNSSARFFQGDKEAEALAWLSEGA